VPRRSLDSLRVFSGAMSRFADAPNRYWHCNIATENDRFSNKLHDMTKQELLERVVHPWRDRRPLNIAGTVIRDHDKIKHVQIVQTSKRSSHYIQAAKARSDFGFAFADFRAGKDYTHELLDSVLASKGPSRDIALLIQLCSRLSNSAKSLAKRRDKKRPFKIADEYDAQDLLQAIIRAYFKYTVSEQPIKKLANTKSTRADFVIEALGAIIELKYVHGPNEQARILDDFAHDLPYYEQWEHLKVLIYVIYNSNSLNDLDALDQLSGPRSHGDKQYEVHIVRA
jgi:hypothetical protein